MNPWRLVSKLAITVDTDSHLGLLHTAADAPARYAPVPSNVAHVEQCSTWGAMACSIMSAISGDAGAERRSACTAFKDKNGTRVETCGSVPASQP